MNTINMPGFSGEASLYGTRTRYRSFGAEFDCSLSGQSVVAAYHPGPATQYHCRLCLQDCANTLDTCLDFAGVGSIFFPPGILQALCYSDARDCKDQCSTPPLGACCPKACGPVDPSNPGEGCCEAEDTCCDGTCCPPNLFCYGGGVCDEPPVPGFPNNPAPPPPPNNCIFGGEPCGPKCCPPGLQCCDYSAQFGPDCRTSCIH
jgi:hypothetical protein